MEELPPIREERASNVFFVVAHHSCGCFHIKTLQFYGAGVVTSSLLYRLCVVNCSCFVLEFVMVETFGSDLD